MTGGQDIVGGMPVPDLARALLAEGVQKVAITTEDPSRYAEARLPDDPSARPPPRRPRSGGWPTSPPSPARRLCSTIRKCATELRRKAQAWPRGRADATRRHQ
jgi:indolepyruvate ferredoxin oxidoreductase